MIVRRYFHRALLICCGLLCAPGVVVRAAALADIGDYARLNDWWRRQFPDVDVAPARFTFQAGALPFGCKIEVQAVATHDH